MSRTRAHANWRRGRSRSENDAAAAFEVLNRKLDELKGRGVLHDGYARVQGDAVRLAVPTPHSPAEANPIPRPFADALRDQHLHARAESVITTDAWTVLRLRVTSDLPADT